jgi:hypothetical protein
MIPVPDAFGAGFGRALNRTLNFGDVDPSDNVVSIDPLLDDFQRGELLFALRDGSTTNSNRITYLPVRYVTRVHADEASGASLPAEGEGYINMGTPIPTGQIVAFVDVPYLTPANTYYVLIERWRRISSTSNNFAKLNPKLINWNTAPLPWVGWAGFGGWGGPASSPDAGMKIRIVENEHGPFFQDPLGGFDRWNGSYSYLDHAEGLSHLVPNLNLRIWIGEPGTWILPAAWEMTLAYPAGKLEITGATLGRTHRSGGLVNVSTTDSPSGCGGPGTTHISVIDPDRQTLWVDVVYRLRDWGCGRAVLSDFTTVENSLKAYDAEGNPMVSPVADLDPEYSF